MVKCPHGCTDDNGAVLQFDSKEAYMKHRQTAHGEGWDMEVNVA